MNIEYLKTQNKLICIRSCKESHKTKSNVIATSRILDSAEYAFQYNIQRKGVLLNFVLYMKKRMNERKTHQSTNLNLNQSALYIQRFMKRLLTCPITHELIPFNKCIEIQATGSQRIHTYNRLALLEYWYYQLKTDRRMTLPLTRRKALMHEVLHACIREFNFDFIKMCIRLVYSTIKTIEYLSYYCNHSSVIDWAITYIQKTCYHKQYSQIEKRNNQMREFMYYITVYLMSIQYPTFSIFLPFA